MCSVFYSSHSLTFPRPWKKKLVFPDFSLTLGRGTVDVRARQNHLPVVVVVVVVAVVVKLLIIKVSTVLAYKNTNWWHYDNK